jgi:hypothetical protein
MTPPDVISTVTSLFIAGMIWLRTRMQYPRGRGALRLERAGRIYFGAAIGLLVLGWLLAPALGRAVWPTTNVTPILMRVVWFLATYYVFILVHRVLKANGVDVFSAPEARTGP